MIDPLRPLAPQIIRQVAAPRRSNFYLRVFAKIARELQILQCAHGPTKVSAA